MPDALGLTVVINDLATLPHHDGQTVLDVRRDDLKVRVQFTQRTYWVHAAAVEPGGGCYTTLMAPRKTPQQARDLAARVWREGKDFNVRIWGDAGAQSRKG